MKEYQFSNESSLMDFIEDRADDKRSHYYWGNIENFDNEMYTLSDLMEYMNLSWFEDGGVVSVYDLEEDEEFITEEPDLDMYPEVITRFDSVSFCGYTQRTTFWDDFSIADRFGGDSVKDTFYRAFNEWKTDVVFMTELTLVLNWKMWQMADMNKEERANIYYGLWIEACDWCEEHFRKGALNYYNKMTD